MTKSCLSVPDQVPEVSLLVFQIGLLDLLELPLLSDNVLKERASKDKLGEEILNSITEFRKNAVGLAAVQLQPYLAARSAVL